MSGVTPDLVTTYLRLMLSHQPINNLELQQILSLPSLTFILIFISSVTTTYAQVITNARLTQS